MRRKKVDHGRSEEEDGQSEEARRSRGRGWPPPHSAGGFFKPRHLHAKEVTKHGSGTTAGVTAGMRSLFNDSSKSKRQDKFAAKRSIPAFVPEVT